MIYEHLAALLPDVPALCFLQELEPFHAGAVPRRRSVQKRQLLERETGRTGNGRAPGCGLDVSAAFMELYLLFMNCRFQRCIDGIVKDSCGWDLQQLAGSSKLLDS